MLQDCHTYTQLAPSSTVYGFPAGSLPKVVWATLPPMYELTSTMMKSLIDAFDIAWAAVIPEMPAPSTTTEALLHFEGTGELVRSWSGVATAN